MSSYRRGEKGVSKIKPPRMKGPGSIAFMPITLIRWATFQNVKTGREERGKGTTFLTKKEGGETPILQRGGKEKGGGRDSILLTRKREIGFLSDPIWMETTEKKRKRGEAPT